MAWMLTVVGLLIAVLAMPLLLVWPRASAQRDLAALTPTYLGAAAT